jgi:hypothetical protein
MELNKEQNKIKCCVFQSRMSLTPTYSMLLDGWSLIKTTVSIGHGVLYDDLGSKNAAATWTQKIMDNKQNETKY